MKAFYKNQKYQKDIYNAHGTNVEVVFTFKDDAATEMAVIGDFCGWVEPGIPMAKNADGKWEVAVKSTMDGVLKYKFWYKGTYIYDFKSPDKIDDGFGAFNGLIEVSKVLAKQKAAELAASGDAAGAAALMAQAGGSSGLKFATWSMLGFQTKFTVGEAMAPESAGLNLNSYWKFSGNATPNMPVFMEVQLAAQSGMDNIYKKGSKEWKDGLLNTLVDTIADPILYYNGGDINNTHLGHFIAGFENDYVTFKTGFKNANMPKRTSAIWTPIENWNAGYGVGGGYSYLETGNAVSEWFKDIAGVKVKAAIAPNKTADRIGTQYGFLAWTSAEFAGHTVDLQYNGAYGYTFDTIFDEIYEADLVVGYTGKIGPVTAKANYVLNGYGAKKVNDTTKAYYTPANLGVAVKDVADNAIDNMAANVQFAYGDDMMDATVGFRFRGAQANLLYVEKPGDQLGDLNHMRAWVDFNYKFAYGNAGINPYMTTKLVKADGEKASIEFGAKLFGGYDFDVAKVDAYANGTFKTQQPEGTKPFTIGDIGLKVSTPLVMNGLSLAIGYDPANADADFITGIFELGLPEGINAQAGLGIRAAKNDSKAYEGKELGWFIGANMKLKALQAPVFYTQLVWNMDAYKSFGDGQDALKYDGYTLDYDVGAGNDNAYIGSGAFRVGLRWEI